MWTRIAANYQVGYSANVLAKYRIHNTNISSRSLISGQNIKDIGTVINIIETYVPKEHRSKIKRSSKINFSRYCARLGHRLYHEFDNQKAALNQVNGALKLSVNSVTIKEAIKLYIKVLINYKKLKKIFK